MAVSPPSSSSGVDPSPREYDVFINFRGGDARHNFISLLRAALCRHDIKVYLDEKSLEQGQDISRALPKAIEESSISIVVFSPNYVDSACCLKELVHILKCKLEKEQIVLPIFYDVEPADIGSIFDDVEPADIGSLKRSFATAFEKHNETDKEEWRKALKEASGIPGWDLRGKAEAVIVEEVAEYVKEQIKYSRPGALENLRKNLEEKLELANNVLEDAEEKQLTDEKVRAWLLEKKELKYRADELLDKINYEELKRKQEGDSKS